jgi:hypothetical protein
VGYPSTYPFVVAIDYNTASEELVLVTNSSGSTLNITRGYNGSSATGHNAGAVVRHVIIAQDLTDFQDHIAAGPAGVHGITGAIATFIGTPTSANLASAVSDETGSGSLVFGTSPTLTTPIINTPTLTTPIISTTTSNTDGAVAWITATDQLSIGTGSAQVVFTSDAGTTTLTNKTLTNPVITESVNAQTGTTYTPVLADAKQMVTLSNASAITLTIPPASSVAYTAGSKIDFIQKGAGQVTFAQGSGVTIRSTGATSTAPKLRAQYSAATAWYEGSDVWYVVGDLA